MRTVTKADAQRRLDRVAGQARAVRGMVEDERAGADVLSQVHAVEALVLSEHIDALYAAERGVAPCEAQTAEYRLKALHHALRHPIGGR